MTQALSDKQLKSLLESNCRLNFWEGSVRSGKTFGSILRFLIALSKGPKGAAMIVGVSRDAIQRNILPELCGMIGLRIPTPKATQINVFGRTVYLIGANDERAQRRIQGSTLALAYVDEVTLIPHGFFRMLLSRLSVPGAQLFGTTNPDSPFHWFKTELLDREDLDMAVWKFRLDDNPSLDQAYIDSLKNEYTGLWYKRYIDGEWVLAEGLVYDFFDEETHVIEQPPGVAREYAIGVDYGTTNPTVFLKIGYNPELWPNMWVESEYYYDSKQYQRAKTDTEYVEDYQDWIGPRPPEAVYIDPSAASLQAEFRYQGIDDVVDADNSVVPGIRFVSNLLANGTLKICRDCSNLIREMQSYRWDEKVSMRGEDKPIKDFDHCFAAGTLVDTANGPKPIESIRVGDLVMTRYGLRPVVKTWASKNPKEIRRYTIGDCSFWATDNHPVITEEGTKPLSAVTKCDILYRNASKNTWLKKAPNVVLEPVALQAVSQEVRNETVYNLTVLEHPEYFANGILVHNCADALRYVCYTRYNGNLNLDADRNAVEAAWNSAREISTELPRFFKNDYDSHDTMRMGVSGGY